MIILTTTLQTPSPFSNYLLNQSNRNPIIHLKQCPSLQVRVKIDNSTAAINHSSQVRQAKTRNGNKIASNDNLSALLCFAMRHEGQYPVKERLRYHIQIHIHIHKNHVIAACQEERIKS